MFEINKFSFENLNDDYLQLSRAKKLDFMFQKNLLKHYLSDNLDKLML